MKSFNNPRSILNRIAFTLAGVALLTSTALAQEKGAQQLIKQPSASATQTQSANDHVGMSCAKCKDTLVTTAQLAGKGARQTVQSSRHECPTCSTKIVTSGTGKLAQNKAVHSCQEAARASTSCCAQASAAGTTPVVDKHKH